MDGQFLKSNNNEIFSVPILYYLLQSSFQVNVPNLLTALLMIGMSLDPTIVSVTVILST